MKSPRHLDLFEATRDRHDRLDGRLGALVNQADYAFYLTAMSRFRSTVEPVVARHARACRELPPVMIAAELADDCRAIGVTPPPSATTPSARLVLADNHAAWLGAVYVLEGSALGGRLIARRLDAMGLKGPSGRTNLDKLCRENRWPAFLRVLETAPNYDAREAAAAAMQVFDVALASTEICAHAA